MCFGGSKKSRAVSSVCLAKIAIVLIVICCTQSSEGGSLRGQTVINKKKISACLNYGHSCWGAHGKRSEQFKSTPAREDGPVMEVPMDIRWFLSRLYGGYKGMEAVAPKPYRERQLLRENQDIDELLKSISEDEDPRYSTGPFYQDEVKALKDNQLLKLLKNQKLDEVIHN